MSELIQARRVNMRWQLLATVSALALATTVYVTAEARADETDRPSIWIELGAQLQRVNGGQDAFTPPFMLKNLNAPHNFVYPLALQRLPRSDFGGEGKITFEPKGSDWKFSAAIRYGRSIANRTVHQQTTTHHPLHNGHIGTFLYLLLPDQPGYRFDHTKLKAQSSHAIADFMAGRDVGLGLFGASNPSTLGFGVRFAQFNTKSNTSFHSIPDPHYGAGPKYDDEGHHHSYFSTDHDTRSFRGLGPSVSWEGEARLIGNSDESRLTFDWGANAAVLFGRQKVSGRHQTSGRYFLGSRYRAAVQTNHYLTSKRFDRSRSKIVPNIGGFAGLSARYSHAKFSLGYRGDFFFGAMDGGIDARDTRNRSFHGPFATISVGLGG